jgi:hypothetical protein
MIPDTEKWPQQAAHEIVNELCAHSSEFNARIKIHGEYHFQKALTKIIVKAWIGANIPPYTEEDSYTRAGGDTICESCGLTYWDHPDEPNSFVLSSDNKPFLKVLCNGQRVKL